MPFEFSIEKAVSILRQGGLVAMPTETVYGLGADASNPDSLRKIFFAKQRPIDHPLIVHIAAVSQLHDWADDISETALLLAKTFWPGPLTLILKKKSHVSDLVTGNQNTIGLRIPNHSVALELLSAFGGGVAAPSANRYGRISPTTAEAVKEELGDAVDLILEGGACEVGVESTIVDVTGVVPVILRPGMITATQIQNVLHQDVSITNKNSPRVSGSMVSHYAPRTTTKLVASDQLTEFLSGLKSESFPLALLARNPQSVSDNRIRLVMMPNHPEKYAHDLYQTLRDVDKKNLNLIVIEDVPGDVGWDAIRDRLQRASG